MKATAFCILCIIGFCSPCLKVRAQDPYYRSIGRSQGLPSNAVYDIYQDSKGFIWLAHGEGLSRYDGHTFVNYSSSEQTSRAGTNISEDRYGRIWYMNFDGYLYYVEHDTMKTLPGQSKGLGFVNHAIVGKYLMKVEPNALQVLDLENFKRVKSFFISTNTLGTTYSDQAMYYVFQDSLYSLDTMLNLRAIQDLDNRPFYAPSRPVSLGDKMFVQISQAGGKWLCELTESGIKRVSDISKVPYARGTRATDNKIWILTFSGVYAFTADGAALNHGAPYFPGKHISAVMKDREGNMWFASSNEGVLFVPNMETRVINPHHYRFNFIRVHGDRLFAGTQSDELLRFNLRDYSYKVLRSSKENNENYTLCIDTLKQRCFFSSSKLFVFDYEGRKIDSFAGAVKEICSVDNAYYAFAASGGSGLLSLAQHPPGPWDSLYTLLDRNRMMERAWTYTPLQMMRGKSVIYVPCKKSIFFAGNQGLFTMNPNNFKEIKWKEKTLYFSKLEHYRDTVYALSTHGNLYTVDRKEEVKERQMSAGLTFKKIRLSSHYLFLFAKDDLYYIDLDLKVQSLQSLQVSMGIEDVNDLEIWQDKLLLAGSKGITILPFMGRNYNKLSPRLVLNGCYAGADFFAPFSQPSFSYKQNDISIHYSILSFASGFNYPLYYRINQEDWRQCEPQSQSLHLASLSPGDYQVSFRLGNDERYGVQQCSFFIERPFWLKYWFILLCTLLVAAIGLGVYRWQTNILKRRNTLLVEKLELERNLRQSMLTSIKSQMNPHFFYNALNTIQSFIYSDDKRNASSYLSKFSRLTRTILEMSEQEEITLAEEIQALRLYLEIEQARFPSGFMFSLRVDESLDIDWVRIPSMIVQPYVENAVKHGLLHKEGEKLLQISFEKKGNSLYISIDDNGIGRKKSRELNAIKQSRHKSFAMQANARRIEILNKDNNHIGLEYIDKVNEGGYAAGTTVRIILPLPITHE